MLITCHLARPWCGQEVRGSLKCSQHWKNFSPIVGENCEIWRRNASVIFSEKNFFKTSPWRVCQKWIESDLTELNHVLVVSFKQKEKSLRKKKFPWTMVVHHQWACILKFLNKGIRPFRIYPMKLRKHLHHAQPYIQNGVLGWKNNTWTWCLSRRVHVIPQCSELGSFHVSMNAPAFHIITPQAMCRIQMKVLWQSTHWWVKHYIWILLGMVGWNKIW